MPDQEVRMERILVGLEPAEGSLWSGIHALNLAKRIDAKVSFLLVIDPDLDKPKQALQEQWKTHMMKSLGALIEEGRSEGITVDYFVAYGKFDVEIVKFIKENRITMLVVGMPADQKGSSGSFAELLEKVRHRIDCRIEIVHEKNLKPTVRRRR
jgi:nucleotide-binding universal stress UspA family protein